MAWYPFHVSDDDLFKISLDGLDADGRLVSLDTVDPKVLLELGISYLNALAAVAEDEDVVLNLRGLHTLEGSAVLATVTDDVEATQECAHVVNGLVQAEIGPSYINPLRNKLLSLPPTMSLVVANQNWREPVVTAKPLGVRRERLSTRVTVIRAGGARPAIRVEDVIKHRRFTLQTCDQEEAQRLAQFLYRDIDIKAEVTRRPDGGFTDGRLISFTQLDDVDPLTAWRSWFAKHDEYWHRVPDDDLTRKLKR